MFLIVGHISKPGGGVAPNRLSVKIVMKQSYKTYAGLVIVFSLSFALAVFLPIDKIFKGIASTPAIVALIGVIYQIFRDQSAFEKEKYLQRKQQIFNLGATSHMANIAFDKHAEFCERYMSEIHVTVSTLFVNGPTEKVMEHVAKLVNIQKEYSAWVPKDIAIKLDPFERALNEIAANSHLVEVLRGEDQKGRNNAVHKMYDIFKQVLNVEHKEITEENKDIAVEEVKQKIRSILGIDELTEMRKMLIQEAISFLKNRA